MSTTELSPQGFTDVAAQAVGEGDQGVQVAGVQAEGWVHSAVRRVGQALHFLAFEDTVVNEGAERARREGLLHRQTSVSGEHHDYVTATTNMPVGWR